MCCIECAVRLYWEDYEGVSGAGEVEDCLWCVLVR